jgi:hypothetical protein
MNNDRFLLEFTDGDDVIEANDLYKTYLATNDVFETLDAASKLIAHQKLDINTYINTACFI